MLPVVIDIARPIQTLPSQLLMPMACSSLLGSLITLVSTLSNLITLSILIKRSTKGLTHFELMPIGVPALIIGTTPASDGKLHLS